MPKKGKGGKKATDEKKPVEASEDAATPTPPVTEDVTESVVKTEEVEAAPQAIIAAGEGEPPAEEAAGEEGESAAEEPMAAEEANVKGATGDSDGDAARGEEVVGGAGEEGKGQTTASAADTAAALDAVASGVETAAAPDAAAQAGADVVEEGATGEERTLRDDSDCFIGDYTKSGAGQVTLGDKL